MPSPRFLRLPPEQRHSILDVARRQFAADGVATASYNKIIELSGISKSSAYQYFDGRDDVLEAVLADLRDRLTQLLGGWVPASTEQSFWQQLRDDSTRLHRHLADNPDDLALVDAVTARAPSDGPDPGTVWLGEVIDNGTALGVVRADTDPDLLLAASAAVLQSIDRWAIARLRADPDAPSSDLEQAHRLLAALWSEVP
ncbi:TetR/AcrR family transcriptional regulator [Aquipuribacter sp. MA13-6]|uniref:TetR/AcrR family transcriptional regulator n=1 Tax=unclassified Aquipuribacter TaxID=2635084 RepID=UPI003EECC4DC